MLSFCLSFATKKERLDNVISVVIYDREDLRRNNCTTIIRNFFYDGSDYYKVYEFSKYNKEMRDKLCKIEGVRIFLINIDDDNSVGLEIAREIRYAGDFISPIILLTSRERQDYVDKIQNILFLDIVKIDERFIKSLTINLREAYSIATRHSVYTFSIFDELYRIPYNDIYYIKKNINDDSVTIYTKDDSYLHYATVKSIERELGSDVRFFKSHRSCIINLYNVTSYDRKDNIAIFKNGQKIDHVARNRKSKLAQRLKDYCNDSINV